jgi:hypothetical protein
MQRQSAGPPSMTSHAGLQDAHQLRLGIQRIRSSTGDLPERVGAAAWTRLFAWDLELLSERRLRSDVSAYAPAGMAMMRGEISEHRCAHPWSHKSFSPGPEGRHLGMFPAPSQPVCLQSDGCSWLRLCSAVLRFACKTRFALGGNSQNGFEKARKCHRNGARHDDLFIRKLSAGCRN